MIADHESQGRFDAISQMSAEIATLNTEIEGLKHARDAARLRAERAEDVVKQLEKQITHPVKEVFTLVQQPQNPEDWRKADADIAERINAGWAVASEIVNTIEITGKVQHFRIVRFIRTAPIEPAPDFVGPRRALSVDDVQPTINQSLTVQPVADEPAPDSPAHPSIAGLWNALYALDRFAELVQHWLRLADYTPRVYAVFEAAGCDMNDVVIMKSFRFGHRADEWTLKAIFPVSSQIMPGTRTALVAAGFGTVIQRDGREFIFDLPGDWVGETPRKTITAASMTIIDNDAEAAPEDDPRAQLHDVAQAAYNEAMANNPLPPYRQFPFTSPNSV